MHCILETPYKLVFELTIVEEGIMIYNKPPMLAPMELKKGKRTPLAYPHGESSRK